MKKICVTLMLLATTVLTAGAATKKVESTELQRGGQFMDLLLPMEGSVAATESDWGTTAGENTKYAGTWEGTLGRWKDNGIEDTERSYWGGNIVRGSDGRYHIYVAGWPSATCGHMQWSSKSMVYHVVADNVWGPYRYVSTLGTGHNPEIYKTGDTYVIYRIEPLGYYKSATLGDTWQTGEYAFDLRDRTLIAGENRETSLSNCSFARREDGSFVMIDRGGGIWVSRDGLDDPWHQLTDASVYLNSRITTRGSLEDPVIWRDHLQYHMIVNDWRARYAYYYRSLDGLHWTMEAGKAYTGQDPFARHEDGTVEKWHKYERPRVFQDEQGRAVRMNFAVIDCVKQSDLAGDDHSSKNINMPLTRQLLLEVLGSEAITAQTTSIRVLVRAEEGFDPRTDLELTTLRFGSHDKVNFGNGFTYVSSENSGTGDLVITFAGDAGESGITAGEWAPKMLGRKTDGTIAFGYARMPAVDYRPAMLSALTPDIGTDGTVRSIRVTNYGQSGSRATTVRVYNPGGTALLAHGTTSAIAAYATENVVLTKDAAAQAGYKSIQVRFYDGETLLCTENIPLTAIIAAQTALQTLIAQANDLYNDASLPNGKQALKTAIDKATAVVGSYDAEAIASQHAALLAAVNACKFANASPTKGLEIDVPNATMDAIEPWEVLRSAANGDTPGWSISAKGAAYAGFEDRFMETWVNQNSSLATANYARQTLSDMPAGRYRLRAKVIACRQNNTSATTGVTLFANDEKTECKTANNTPTEFMVEVRLDKAGQLTIGIDIPATTQANWVAWDNVSLKYFGTGEGDIVEDEPEPVVYNIDTRQVYELMHFNTRRPRYLKAEPLADGTLSTTNTANERGHFCFVPVAGQTDTYYIYEMRQKHFVTPSTGRWTLSAGIPAAIRMTSNAANAANFVSEGITWLIGENNQHANPQQADGSEVVKAYSDHPADAGNNWQLVAVGGETPCIDLTPVSAAIPSLVQSAAAEDISLAYSATVGASGYGTLVVPFEADIAGPVAAYTLTGVNNDDAVIGHKTATIMANKPVLLKGEGTLTLTSKAGSTVFSGSPADGLLTGVYASTLAPVGSYVLQSQADGVGFFRVDSGNQPIMEPFRAYLAVADNQARRLTIALDEASGIGNVAVGRCDEIYSLNGMRHTATVRGLNIVRTGDGTAKKVCRK